MIERRVILDTASFLDSAAALAIAGAPTASIREIVQRFLSACYVDLGKAPRLVDGDELGQLLAELLPRHFGVKDPLAGAVEEVLGAYLVHLDETEVVVLAYEQRLALSGGIEAFQRAVASGAAHAEGLAVVGKPKTVVHRAAKVGRNDPCPCGSGKKFKKCCMQI